jgi:hypothetical protein
MSRDISSGAGVGGNPSQDFATAESLNRQWRSAQQQQQQQQTHWQSEQQQQSAWPSSDPQPAWRLSEHQQPHWRSGPHTEPQSPWRADSQQQSSAWRSDPQRSDPQHWHPSWRSSEPQSTPLPRESDQLLLGRSAEAQRAAEALLSSSLSSSVNSLASVHNDPVGRKGLTRQ